MDDLEKLEDWVTPLIARLSVGERLRLARTIARELRTVQRQNIKAQKNPEGSAWEKRKNTAQQNKNKPIRFIYKKRDGEVREVQMRSWRREGGGIIGYELQAGGVRTLRSEGILKSLATSGMAGGSGKPTTKTIRRKLFERIGNKLKATGTPGVAEVFFGGGSDRLARIHHFGLRDKVKPGGPEYDYPARPLLGITDAQMERVRDMLLQHLSKG